MAHKVALADGFLESPFRARSGTDSDESHDISACKAMARMSWIKARVVLLSRTRIWEGAGIGAGSSVNFEEPPYAVVGGESRLRDWPDQIIIRTTKRELADSSR